jgi:transcriptional regulator with XRE-family HTH domain
MPEQKPCLKCSRLYFPLRRGFCNRCDAKRRALHGYQCSYVDAGPVRAHLETLRQAGLGLRRIAEITGVSRKTLNCLANGRSDRGSGPSKRVSAWTAGAVLAVEIPRVAHRVVAGGQIVDAIGTVRRLQSLVAFGYPRSYLAARIGMQPSNITKFFDPATLTVCASTARRVEALFAELQTTPGPSQRARNEGVRRGWDVPLAWEENELDRFAVDTTPAEAPATKDEVDFSELYAELRYLGFRDADIAARYGIEVASLRQRLTRLEVAAQETRLAS